MKTIEFNETEDKISIKEYLELVEDFKRTLVVGLECERAVNIDQRLLAQHLKTQYIGYGQSRNDSSLAGFKKATSNEFNVAFVTTDSSVNHDNEILFTGTSEKFGWIHDRLLKLEKKLDTLRCSDYDKTCSNHITLLTLQDKIINPIVVKNLYNLTRAFSPALYWICSGDSQNVVRSGAKSYAQFSNLNPKNRAFSELKSMNSRTSILNLSKQNIIQIGGLERLSGLIVEFRNPDGIRVPSALTSLMMLFKALSFKAVEISTKGLVSVESLCDWERNKKICRKLVGSYQELEFNLSDIRDCQKQANELIDLVLPQLKQISPESIPILRELAKKPISQRTGKWTTIEKSLLKQTNKKFTANEEKLVEIMISGEIRDKKATGWKKKVAGKIGVTDRMVEYMMKRIEGKISQRFTFDYEMESYIFE